MRSLRSAEQAAYFETVAPTEHLRTREALERAMHTEPDNAIVRACLSSIYLDEYRFEFNRRDGPLERALDAAQRAVELDATCALAWTSLAVTQFFRGDQPAFRIAFEKAEKLNPRDASSLALLGIQISHSGDWEEGLELPVPDVASSRWGAATGGTVAQFPKTDLWRLRLLYEIRRTKGPRKNNFPFWHPIFTPSSAAPQSQNPQKSAAIPPDLLNRSRPNLTQIWAPILGTYSCAGP